MGLYIGSKSGTKFKIGYGSFHWMRGELLEQMMPGLGSLYEWAGAEYSGNLWGIECRYTELQEDGGRVYSLPFHCRPATFARTCCDLIGTWLKAEGFSYAWKHFFCHSDCDGKLTGRQCQRLIKDLDRMKPGHQYEGVFTEFRELVRKAADRNETLFFK